MKVLNKLFPLSLIAKTGRSNSLAFSILAYVAVTLVYFLVASVTGMELGRVAEWLLGLLGIFVGLYCTAGVVVAVLRYCGIIK